LKSPIVNNILSEYTQQQYDKVFVTHWGKSTLTYNATEVHYNTSAPQFHNEHEIDHNMRLIREQGYNATTPDQYVYVDPQPKATFPKVIGLHWGCFGGVWEKKKYPYFASLAYELMERGFIVKNFGNDKEKLPLDHPNYIELAGVLSLQDTINELSSCNYFIANDSGLMHVADALQIPLVAIFGPTLVTKNRPVSSTSKVLVGNLPCEPCQYTNNFNTCSKNICLTLMLPNVILEYITTTLKWDH